MAAPASVTLLKSAGRLKDGDDVMVLKVPENTSFRHEKMTFRVMPSGQPVLVLRIAPDNGSGQPGAYGDEHIKQIEYWGNYATWVTFDAYQFIKKLVDSNVFATGAMLTGQYSPNSRFPTNATSQETDYMIDANGEITKSAKPATGNDVKEGQDKQNALLGQIAAGLTGGSSNNSGSSSGTTATQKIVRVVLFVLGGGLIIWGATKLLGKKKK